MEHENCTCAACIADRESRMMTAEDRQAIAFIQNARADRIVGWGAGLGNARALVMADVRREQKAMARGR